MTLDQIETFINVVECGSFKSASEKLFRSQPALSVAVKKLEEELGVTLFNREEYRPKLTEQGEAFFIRSKELFSKAKSLENFGKELGLGHEIEIKIAIDGICPLPEILKVIRLFNKEYPATKINLSFEIIGGAPEKLSNGSVQLAISPGLEVDPASFVMNKMTEVKMVPVASSLLFEKPIDKIKYAELKEFPQIVVRSTGDESSNRSYGVIDGGRQWSVGDLQTKKEIIQAGLGWGNLPIHNVHNELKSGDLYDLSRNGLVSSSIPIYLMKSVSFPQGPLSKRMWELFTDAFSL
ncbi:LysR family transcriptional regulator [Bacteriovoracaceae bacterium]|nr:LysR family transcriptional regulator [Bacteriovoracaceae bacterium]